jgi:hypothetical protein
VHLIYGCASHIWLCIYTHMNTYMQAYVSPMRNTSYMGAHLTYRRASRASHIHAVPHTQRASIGMHLTHRRATNTQACILHIGLHDTYMRAPQVWACISDMSVRLRYGRASQVWACMSGMGVHVRYGRACKVPPLPQPLAQKDRTNLSFLLRLMVEYLIYRDPDSASQVWVCISGMSVHLRHGRVSQVWACISGMSGRASQV